MNAGADAAASQALNIAWARGEPARVGTEVIRDWTARSLQRQHAGLVRQRRNAGFLGGRGDNPHQQEVAQQQQQQPPRPQEQDTEAPPSTFPEEQGGAPA